MAMWDKFIDLSEELKLIFDENASRDPDDRIWNECHTNHFWRSSKLEMGHMSIIDMRDSKGMWMMHVNAYSIDETPMPIYGFDVVCGKNKVTGCFHDMSPTNAKDHPVCRKFQEQVSPFVPQRTRELPDWAKEIFSGSMIAAGNVKDEKEADRLVSFAIQHLKDWFEFVNSLNAEQVLKWNGSEWYNVDVPYLSHLAGKSKYCENQLKNENSKNVMISLGLEEGYVNSFKRIQFPF